MKKVLLILNLILLIPNLANSQVANQPSDLVTCDYANTGGFAEFDLTVNNTQILGDQDPSNFEINYYWTQPDADTDVNRINPPTSFVNATNPQQIYARINDLSNENFDTTNFQIMVLSLPTIADISPLEACDDTVGASNDGLAEFDLSSKNEEILNGQDPTLYTVSYYENHANAQNAVNPLPSLYVNLSNPQPIYVRVANNVAGCYNTSTFDLIAIDCTDNDDDGVIDSDEDVNSNGNLDDDDTDQDEIANYMDSDDDGDNVDTVNEINMTSGRYSNLSYTFIDTDGDTIPNHIDDDDDGDGILTIDEDYNNNGDPTDDDTDNSGIADYLESSVALNISSFEPDQFILYPNPSRSMVYIEGVYEGIDISIFDIQGRKISLDIQKASHKKLSINVAKLNRGIYLFRIQDNSKQESHILIVD